MKRNHKRVLAFLLAITITSVNVIANNSEQNRFPVLANENNVLDFIQPKDITAKPNATVKFSVGEDIEGYTYQWQWRQLSTDKWTNCSVGAPTTAILSVIATQYRNGYQYRCIVTDSSGNAVASDAATLTVSDKTILEIKDHPENITVKPNGNAYFTVNALGDGLTYQWQWRENENNDWSNSTSGNQNTQTLTVVALYRRQGYQYRCIVTDIYGNTVVSDTATLIVSDKISPEIKEQPKDVVVKLNGNAYFNINAIGNDLTYQWQWRENENKDWRNSTTGNPKTSILSVTAANFRKGYQYRCLVSDGITTIESNIATLSIASPITVSKNLISSTITSVDNAVFTVEATGTDDLTYLWESSTDGENWTTCGENSNTLIVDGKTAVSGTQYRCTVSDNYGQKVKSNSATLTIVSPISINSSPKSTTIKPNETATFSVVAEGEELVYQWKYSNDGKAWQNYNGEGANTSSIVISGADAIDGTQYKCVVTDKYGQEAVTEPATLTIKEPLVISSQPVSITVTENNKVTFSIEATGENISYQWQKATADTEDLQWTDIEGATYGTYTFTAALADNENRYRCIVSDGDDTINSSVATLTVKPENAVITNGTKEITINKNEAYQLDLVGKGLRYISNASNITVDKYGVVNAKETGTGYVFVIDSYGHKCFYKIHVVEKYEELAFDEIEYNVMPGESVRLYTNKNASYVISDDDKASIYYYYYYDNYCDVTCFVPGVYTAIAYTENGEFTFTTINVSGEVTDIESKTSYEGETDTNNSVWYKYVNNSDVEELITFDIENSSNAAYVYYNQGSYSEPNYYWEDEIARNQMYVQPGDEVYVRMISDSDNAANYDFTVNIVPCASVDYTIGEELEDVVLDRDDYTEYSFTPDSSGEYELTAFSRNEFNWIITDSENNVVKNEYSNGAVYKTFNLKENENYTIRFTPNSMTETGSLTFEITKAEDNITVADVNTVYDTGIIRSGQTVYYKFEICKNSDNPAFDVFAFSREYSDYLSYTVLGSDMFTPYELNWDEGIAKLYFEEATDIYVKIENKSESADTPNFEIKQYEKTVTQLSEEAENTAEIGAYEADWYEFTAPENGNYCISFGFDSYTDNFMPLNFEIYTGDDLVYDEDLSVYYMYDGYGFNHTMVKGEKLYVKVTGNCSENNENGAMSYNWSITSNQTYLLEELTLDSLTEGSTVNGKQTVFKFTAPVSGTYYFWSESKCNMYGNLSSMPNGDYIVGDDNSGYANNFCFAHRISAGETVYLNCHQIDNCDCEYNVMVSKTNRSQEYEPVFETIEMILDTPVSGYYENADGFDIFSFTSEMAGTYVFTSENAVDIYGNVADMYGELYSDDALTNQLTYDDDGSESYRQFRIEYELEEGQTVYLKPYNLSEYDSCDYIVTVTKTEEMNETEILGTVDSYGDISTSSSFNTDSSSAIIQVNCVNSIPMDFYMLTNSEINMWTALSLESDDNRENEQTGIEFSFNYAPMADCYYIFIETTDGSSIGDIEVGYTYNELEPGYEDVCSECGGLNSEHTPECSMGFVEDGSED